MHDTSNGTRPQMAPLAALLLAGVGFFQTAVAQTAAPAPLDAQASDPRVMGWMVGAPPPANKLISLPTAVGSGFRRRAGRSRTFGS